MLGAAGSQLDVATWELVIPKGCGVPSNWNGEHWEGLELWANLHPTALRLQGSFFFRIRSIRREERRTDVVPARRGSVALHPSEEQAGGIRRGRGVPGHRPSPRVPSGAPAATSCGLKPEPGAVLSPEPTQLPGRRHRDYFS